jgi:hypothetical protein
VSFKDNRENIIFLYYPYLNLLLKFETIAGVIQIFVEFLKNTKSIKNETND